MKLNKHCSLCDKKIVVNVDNKTKKITTKNVFHSKIPKRFFDGWVYAMETKSPMQIAELKPIFKNTFWKVIGYTRIQRKVVYFFIHLVLERRTQEYWECSKCLKKK